VIDYGEAIPPGALERAVSLALKLLAENSGSPGSIAAEAVARIYCVCVTAGEDAAERRVSDVHRSLIEAVTQRLRSAKTTAAGNDIQRRFERRG
jgi:hypothetical protein